MTKWLAVLAAIAFLIIVSVAAWDESAASRYQAQAAYESARAYSLAQQTIARGEARAAVLDAAIPYFVVFAVFVFGGLVVTLIAYRGNQPTITNNYILEVPGAKDSAYYYFDRVDGRVRFVDGGSQRPSNGGSAVQHRRLVYDQKDLG